MPTTKKQMGYLDLIHDFAGGRVGFSVQNKIIYVVDAVNRNYILTNASTAHNAETSGNSLSVAIPPTPLNNINSMSVLQAQAALQVLINHMGIVTPIVFDLPLYDASGLEITPQHEIKIFVEGSNQLKALFEKCFEGVPLDRASNLVPYCTIATIADSAPTIGTNLFRRKIRFIKGPYDVNVPVHDRPGRCSQENITYRLNGNMPIHTTQRPGGPGQPATAASITQAEYNGAPNHEVFFLIYKQHIHVIYSLMEYKYFLIQPKDFIQQNQDHLLLNLLQK